MHLRRLRPHVWNRTSLVKKSVVPSGNWNNDQVNFNENNPDNQNDNARVRPSVMVYVLWLALSQPPSMRPISARLACSWKIFVSFANPSSSIRRSLNNVISSLLIAFIKYPPLSGFGAFLAIIKFSRQSKTEVSRLRPSPYFQRFCNFSFASIMPL